MSAWYDLTPAQYAIGLRYRADRSHEIAVRKATEGKPWSAYDADRYARQATRLRAMALLCERASASRAGDVDFMGLSDPTLSREAEDTAVAAVESPCVFAKS